MLRIDAVRVALLGAACFIADFENLHVSGGRYVWDYETSLMGTDLVLTCECRLNACSGLPDGFMFWIEPKEMDAGILLDGSVPVACKVAVGFINEYMRRVNNSGLA